MSNLLHGFIRTLAGLPFNPNKNGGGSMSRHLLLRMVLVAIFAIVLPSTAFAAPAESNEDVLYCNTKSECLEAFPLLMNWLVNNQKDLFVPSSTGRIERTINRFGAKKQKDNLRKGMATLPQALADILDIFGKNPVDASAFEKYASPVDADALESLAISAVNGSSDEVLKKNATFVLEMGQAIDLNDVPELKSLKVALYNWALLTLPMSDWPVTDDLITLIGKDACILKTSGEKVCEVVEAIDEDSVTLKGNEKFTFGSEDSLLFGELPEGFGEASGINNDGASLGLEVNPFAVFPSGADTAFVMKEGLSFDWTFAKPISVGLGVGALTVVAGGTQNGYNLTASAVEKTTGYVSGRLGFSPSVSKNGRVRIAIRGEGSVFFTGGGSVTANVGPEFIFGKEDRKTKGKCGFGVSGGWFDYGRPVSGFVDSTGVRDKSKDRNLSGPAVGGWASCGLLFGGG